MVQDVERVRAELNALGFADLEPLAQIGVKTPNRKTPEDVLTQGPTLSRKRILQNDQIRFSACIVERNRAGGAGRNDLGQSLQSAARSGPAVQVLQRRHQTTLRIRNLRPPAIGVIDDVVSIEVTPFRKAGAGRESPADVRIGKQFLQ